MSMLQSAHLMHSTGLASIPACASGKSISGTQLIKVRWEY